MGEEAFASIGTEKSKGTKVFALSGKIALTGLVEIPMGTTVREVIFDIAGGIKGEKDLKLFRLADLQEVVSPGKTWISRLIMIHF